MSMNEAEIRALVDGLVSAWNDRDIDRFMSYLDEAVVWDDPAMLYGPATGRAEVRRFAESVLRAFPDFSYRLREPICIAPTGTRCAVPWEITATHTGYFDYLRLAPTGQAVTMRGVDLLELAGTKVARVETLFNVLPAAEQALRLKPLARNRLARAALPWLQRCLAWWLRRTTGGRTAGRQTTEGSITGAKR
ncbi:MAG: nuclear transport factor 2 family protein [bacterium]